MFLSDSLAVSDGVAVFTSVVAGLPLAWLLWRIWAFTIAPAMKPHHPAPLPYLLPYIGHLRGMMSNPQTVFAKGIAHFASRAVFSVTVMGEELYIATSAHDINSVYKDTQNLDFDAVIRDLLSEFGIARDTLDRLFDADLPAPAGPGRGRSWMDRQHDVYRAQMLPGPGGRGDAMAADLVARVDRAVRWADLAAPVVVRGPRGPEDGGGEGARIVSLWRWCARVLVGAATGAFFGDALLAREPGFVADYLEFDEGYWRLKARSPATAAETRQKCVSALRRWLDRPGRERGDACWMVDKTVQDLAALGVRDNGQVAALLFINYEVINGNAYKSAFWLLAHALFDPALLGEIRAEVDEASSRADPAAGGAPGPDTIVTRLLDAARSPHLNAAYDEVLRHANNAMGVRLVARETTLGGRTLRPGRKLLMPYRQLHLDEAPSAWGGGGGRGAAAPAPTPAPAPARPAAEFDAGRFVRDADLARSPSFRPFGGGNGYCPGRFLARREVFMFVAAALGRFEMALVSGDPRGFPELDLGTPTGGILTPKAGQDVLVRVKPRI